MYLPDCILAPRYRQALPPGGRLWPSDVDDDVDQEGSPRPQASYKPCWPSLRGPQGGKTFLEIEIFISVTNVCYGYFMQLLLSQHFELKQYKQKHFTIASFTGMTTYDSDDDDNSDGDDDYDDIDYGYECDE